MQYDEVVLGRRSTRGFTSDPVPRELIEEILTLAMRAPSSMNTQPWNFHVVTGEPLDRIRAGNTERNLAGVPHSREFRTGAAKFTGTHRDRQVQVAKQLFGAMGIARDVTRNGAWLPEVGDSTHYHATYVRPNWIRDMVKEDRIGRHIFYRVRWRAPLDA